MIIPFPTEWKVIKFMFQTINQIYMLSPQEKTSGAGVVLYFLSCTKTGLFFIGGRL
jgi:hypothetical protein